MHNLINFIINMFYIIAIIIACYLLCFVLVFSLVKIARLFREFLIKQKKQEIENNIKVKAVKKIESKTYNPSLGVWEVDEKDI